MIMHLVSWHRTLKDPAAPMMADLHDICISVVGSHLLADERLLGSLELIIIDKRTWKWCRVNTLKL